MKIAVRSSFSQRPRSCLRSIWARVSLMSVPYWTPDGQAVTHAMQPRQLSMCPTMASVIGSPSSPSFIR